MTVYRRPDPIPLRRSRPVSALPLLSVRSEQDDLHALISRRIFAAIMSGQFPEGSILPNETVLGEELGVSRTALREAVKSLSAKGLLETRRRRGTMVLDRSQWNFVDPEMIGWLSRDEPNSVAAELWAAVAEVLPGAASFAASRRISLPVSGATGDAEAELRARAGFLLTVAAAAGNRFLSSMVSVGIGSLLAISPELLAERLAPLTFEARGRLAEVIARGRSDDAAEQMRRMLTPAKTAAPLVAN